MTFKILTAADTEYIQTGTTSAEWDEIETALNDGNVVIVNTKSRRNITLAMKTRDLPKLKMTKQPDGYAVWI